MLIGIGVLVAIVVTFYGLRLATDVPFLATGTVPESDDSRAGTSLTRGWPTCT